MSAIFRKLSVIAVPLLVLTAGAAWAAPAPGPETGQVILVPAYSHIYVGPHEKPFPLTITLAVRNTDQTRAVTLTAVDYYDATGNLVRAYLDKPVALAPGQSVSYIVKESKQASPSGIGVSFRITWGGDRRLSPPLAEAVMIGAGGQQGISFTSRGVLVSPMEP